LRCLINLKNLEGIFSDNVPFGRMLVGTKKNDVYLVGTNKQGLVVPANNVDEFIDELQKRCFDTGLTYQIEKMEIPGSKLRKAAFYLREARDIGINLASYKVIF